MKQKKLGLSKDEIQTLFQSKYTKKIHTPYFSLFYLKTPQQTTRCSFVVSKKDAKNAVKRNKLKRQARYIFSKIINENIRKGYKCVVHFKKQALTLPFSELQSEMHTHLRRAHII